MHLEVRGLLRNAAEVHILGDAVEPEVSGFVLAPGFGLAVAYGAPRTLLVDELRSAATEVMVVRDGLKLHLPMECAAAWLELDGVSSLGLNRLQAQGRTGQAERMSERIQHEVQIVKERSSPLLGTLPSDLALEFARLDPWPATACAVHEERITSIAYAFVETGHYFDLSIDTLQFFRREGYGTSCAAALILYQATRGKRPVWVASERSQASLALSNRLGFEDVGSMQSALLQ
ncbi:MAG: GNAT superfamily N-acetyltransferase [Planctomycetota bacterium]